MKNTSTISRRLTSRFFLGLVASMALYFCVQQVKAQDNNSLLWKISGNGLSEPSYVFGTYHLINSGSLPEDGKVLAVFNAADGVALEADIEDVDMSKLAGYTIMTDNSLSHFLTAEEFELVDKETRASFGQSLKEMDQLKPVSVSLYMAIIDEIAPELAKVPGEPLDKFFLQTARKNGKSIHTFETVVSQMELLYNSFTLEEQADMLVEGYNNEKISGITGLNKNHLGVKLHRIKHKLTEILEPYRYGPEGTVE